MSENNERMALICRVGAVLCALPLEHVVETMRSLPVEPVAGAPPFVAGVSIVRGEAIVVVDAARLLGDAVAAPAAAPARAGRLVVLDVGGRRVALAVGEALGIRRLAGAAVRQLPPLLRAAGGASAVAALATLDSELLLVLGAARLLPAELLPLLGASSGGGAAPAGLPS